MYSGKVIVITGASSGIGLSTALKAQELGAKVVWGSRTIESNNEIKNILKNESCCKNLDVSNKESVKDFFSFVNQQYGRIDALINSAGYVEPEALFSTTLENWEKTISVNLTGVFLCVKYASLIMRDTGGRIINVASTAGLTPRPGWSAYAAAKSGVINFSHAISEELAQYNIKVFIICPGRTATPLRHILAPTENPRTIMQPETVSDTILFCLSDTASPMEGQPILVRERF